MQTQKTASLGTETSERVWEMESQQEWWQERQREADGGWDAD